MSVLTSSCVRKLWTLSSCLLGLGLHESARSICFLSLLVLNIWQKGTLSVDSISPKLMQIPSAELHKLLSWVWRVNWQEPKVLQTGKRCFFSKEHNSFPAMNWDVHISFLQILQVLSSSKWAKKLTFPLLRFSKVIWALFWIISLSI